MFFHSGNICVECVTHLFDGGNGGLIFFNIINFWLSRLYFFIRLSRLFLFVDTSVLGEFACLIQLRNKQNLLTYIFHCWLQNHIKILIVMPTFKERLKGGPQLYTKNSIARVIVITLENISYCTRWTYSLESLSIQMCIEPIS